MSTELSTQDTAGSLAECPAKVPTSSLSALYLAWLRGEGRQGKPVPFWRSNRLFFTGMLCWCVFLTLAAFWPIVRDCLVGYCRTDCSSILGLAPQKPWYFSDFPWLCLGVLCVLLMHAICCLGVKKFRILRPLSLLGVAGYFLALVGVYDAISLGQRARGALATSDVFELQWENLRQLRIVECEHLRLHTKETRNALRRRDIKTFAEFHPIMMEGYEQRVPQLQKHAASDQKMKTLYIMNFVSGFWCFGNGLDPNKPASVFLNELNGWQVPAESIHAYVDAKIGCCTDYAYLMKYLLDRAGIENRLTAIPGHIFNEVRLDGRWCIADATVNLFVESGWEELYTREKARESITVLMFPIGTSLNDRSPRYRSLTEQFRLMTLLRLANQPANLRATTHPELPSYFQ